MKTVILWFRNDLRLTDNPVVLFCAGNADHVIPIFVADAAQDEMVYGFPRMGEHRRYVRETALNDLDTRLAALGSTLLRLHGNALEILTALYTRFDCAEIVCEKIVAPYEMTEVAQLRRAGCNVQEFWGSSLIDPEDLPFKIEMLPNVFTPFRKRIEDVGVVPAPPRPQPKKFPGLPALSDDIFAENKLPQAILPKLDSRSSFAYAAPGQSVSESGAHAHLAAYLQRKLPHTYKETRNGLTGLDFSSKFSPYLALGCISARSIMAELRAFEKDHGANDGTYWLWFELLWRDYFRFVHLRHGASLYRQGGLRNEPPPPHNVAAFDRWRTARTGHAFIDAGMRELYMTGFLSNRMRQNVASFLIHDLACDWRAGAAWFESMLIDYDVYSNHGNWLSLAGRGTASRAERRFNPEKQATDYDPSGAYRKLWASENALSG